MRSVEKCDSCGRGPRVAPWKFCGPCLAAKVLEWRAAGLMVDVKVLQDLEDATKLPLAQRKL